MGIAIYIEGGGPSEDTKSQLRTGMDEFLQAAKSKARNKGMRWRLVACGGRTDAYKKFVNELKSNPDDFNVLLVDSEEPIPNGVRPWDHLKKRKGDKWKKPAGADDTRCQMMVACMEAWFLADPAGLKRHFGGNFDAAKLPAASLAESRTTAQIDDALAKATKKTAAGAYQKIRDGAKLLGKVDPARVRKHCKWCDRLFKTLGDAIGARV